jgi:ABC-type nitrate/sulfonate/bicarbonate transport system permease component
MIAPTIEPVAPARARPTARRRGHRSTPSVWLLRLGLLILVVGLWQGFAGGPTSSLPSNVVSRPSSVVIAFWHLLFDGALLGALGRTAVSTIYALLISIPGGAIVALASAHPVGRWVLDPIVTVLYAIPKVGLISICVIVLGISRAADVTLVTSTTVFVYFYAFRQAIDEVDRDRLRAIRRMGASWPRVARSLLLGYSIPPFLAACRIAVPLAFATEIFAELRVPATPGLGVKLSLYINSFKSADSVAVMIVILVLGYLLDVVLRGALQRYTASIGLELRR